MKIALFHNLPHGGAKRAAYEWSQRLCQHHQVDLYLIDDVAEEFLSLKESANQWFTFSRKPLGVAGRLTRMISLIKIWILSKKIAKKINSGGYDVALLFQCRVTNTPPILENLNIPSLFVCHESLGRVFEPHYRRQERSRILAIFRKLALKKCIALEKKSSQYATQICTSSLYSIESLYKYFGIYPKLLYPGVKSSFFKPVRTLKETTVVSVGHLSPSKGHEFIIRSLGTIEGKKPRLIIVHKLEHYRFDYRKKLKELSDKNGVEIEFFSSIDDEQLVSIYQKSMLTLCGYHLEPLGLVALESLACGTPVISVAEAGLRETVIDFKTGLLVPRDEKTFGEAVMGLLQDQTLREKMAYNGRQEILKNWDWNQSYKNLERYLGSVINTGRNK